jgi:hypothetical protein
MFMPFARFWGTKCLVLSDFALNLCEEGVRNQVKKKEKIKACFIPTSKERWVICFVNKYTLSI